VSPLVTVSQAAQEMNRRKVGSVLVMEGGQLLGIFTERDVLWRVVAAGLDPKTTPLSQVMTRKPDHGRTRYADSERDGRFHREAISTLAGGR